MNRLYEVVANDHEVHMLFAIIVTLVSGARLLAGMCFLLCLIDTSNLLLANQKSFSLSALVRSIIFKISPLVISYVNRTGGEKANARRKFVLTIDQVLALSFSRFLSSKYIWIN